MSGSGSFWHPVAQRLPEACDNVLLDWPGLGDVPRSPSVQGFDDLVALVLAELATPSAIVAQSMGGAVAIAAALVAPNAVTKLVLCATSGGVDMTGAMDWRPTYRDTWPAAPAWALEKPPDRSTDLGRLRQPTLLLWASDDPISPVTVGQHLEKQIPRSTLVVVASDNHMFARDSPQLVAPTIRAHLGL